MELTITLRKEVADRDEGSAVFELVKQKLADRPEITVTGHITNHFDLMNLPPAPPARV